MLNHQIEQATRQWALAQPTVAAFIASMVSDFRQRDDILQDVAVAVLEHYERYDSERSFTAWAIGVARNKIHNYYRERKRKPLVFDSETIEALATAYEGLSESAQESIGYLNACLQQLEPRSRKICDLRYVDDTKPAGIAKQLGMSANAISKALERIRKRLGECMAQRAAAEGGSL